MFIAKHVWIRRKFFEKIGHLNQSYNSKTVRQLWMNATCLIPYDLPLSLADPRLCTGDPSGAAFPFITAVI